MNLLLQKIRSRMGSPFLIASFILGLVGINASTSFGQAAPSLNVSGTRTCGSPISVTATCTAGNTPTFIASGGSASGSVYTYTAPGSYTLTATCTGSGGTSSPANPVSVAIFPPTSPPTLTPSSAIATQGSTPVVVTPTGCPGGYISYFGTMGVNRDGNIVVPTGTPGVFAISAICTINDCQSVPAVANITITPSSEPVPQPTVISPIPSQTGIVGNTFTYLVSPSTFSDPNNDPLMLAASGLPSGLTFNGLFINGPLTTAGVFPITISAANNRGGSTSTTFQLTVQPAAPTSTTGGPLQLLTPTYNACTRAITFNTTGGDGTTITYTAIGVARANAQSPTGIVDEPIVTDQKTLIIEAMQSGQTTSVNFVPPVCTNQPPSTTAIGGSLQLLPPTYDPCTRTIIINSTGGDGTPITYQTIGVARSSPQSNSGVVEVGVVRDGKTLNLNATQSGVTVGISFTPPQCSENTPLQLQTPSYDPCSRLITFNTLGGNGTPISFTAVGVQRANAQSTFGTVDAAVVANNQTLVIQASQGGSPTVSINFTPTPCTSTTTPTGGTFQLTTPTYDACTRTIIFNTTGGNGSTISYQAIGVARSSPQSNTGIVEVGVVRDGKTLNISATQNGVTSTIAFTPPQCNTTPPPPPGAGAPLQLTTPTYDPCTRAITFNTTGGDGTPITYFAPGVARSSPQSNNGVVEAGVVRDNNTLNISATQSGVTVTIAFTPPQCRNSREASSRESGPQIVILGNPANGNEITIEVVSVEKQPLQVRLIDPQGQAVHDQNIQSPNTVQKVVIPVRSSQKGIFIIQAISGGKATVAKVLHQ